MAKMTIAQLREKALENFNNDYIKDEEKAKNLVRRFYRLSALDERLCYLDNDERTCNSWRTEQEHEKADRMLKRLKDDLKPYNLTIRYYGIYPTLEEIGTQREALTRWFY